MKKAKRLLNPETSILLKWGCLRCHTPLPTFSPTYVIHAHVIIRDSLLIFERNDGLLGPISGKHEIRESLLDTVHRELFEETSIIIHPAQIRSLFFSFHAVSPNKYEPIYGKSFYIVLSDTFNLKRIQLNHELRDFSLLRPREALKALEKNGHPEAIGGLRKLFALKLIV